MKTSTLIATVSAATSVSSIGYDLGDLASFSVQGVFSGSNVAGTLKLQCSNDNTTWVDVPSASTSITSSADEVFNISNAQYRYVRASWTYSSGTGNITCYFVAKEPFKQST
jgi:hypothetical protein